MEYTVHPYDQVLDLYYAKARIYNAADRRFMAVDPVVGQQKEPATFNYYAYSFDNPLVYVDSNGMWTSKVHYDDTKKWARENDMFTEYESETIAASDNYVDNRKSGKSVVSDLSWHFDMSYFDDPKGNHGVDTRGIHFRREKEKAKNALNSARSMEAAAERAVSGWIKGALLFSARESRQEALECFGTALHPIQDKYAHEWFKPKFKESLTALPHEAYFPKFDCNGKETNYVFDAHVGVFDDKKYDLEWMEKRVLTGIEVELMESGSVDIESLGELTKVYVVREGNDRYLATKDRTIKELKEFFDLYTGGQRLEKSPS